MATQAHYPQEHLAPLASLDCSITEPIGEGGSRCDTPTLSGYFECDQLSDMVDDSLFELTAAGCLSSSVFRARANMELDGEEAGEKQATPTNEAPGETRALSAAQLLANRQPYDYSSSSSVPRRRNHNKPRAAQARSQAKQQQQQRKTKRSSQPPEATPSKEDFRQRGDQTGAYLCAQCREQRENQAKQRRRGLFGLFGLFGPDNGAHDKDKWDHNNGQPCVHLQQRLGLSKPPEPSGANRANHQHQQQEVLVPRRSASATRIKSRDSIKLTNQRKQRGNNGPQSIKSSSSHHDNLGGGELLLDLSQHTTVRSSQTSYSLAGRHQTVDRRPMKSVKFTDQVQVAPQQQQQQAVGAIAGQTPTTSLQSIIKMRPQQLIPKSSSYSQTESSKNLEALLAKYEDNEALVKEINEKLRLTETIASPRSALDVGQEEVVIGSSGLEKTSARAPQTEAAEEPQLMQTTSGEASLMSCCDPNKHHLTSATLTEPLDAGAHIGQQANAQHSPQRPMKPRQARGKRRKDYDPDNNSGGNTRTFSDSDDDDDDSTSSSSAPSEAGFSKDWLNKQRALGV